MSNDPSQPKPDLNKISGKTSNQANKATEIDLWDLDSDESDFASAPASPPGGSGGLPSRRSSSGSIQSKKPTDRHTQTPVVGETPELRENPGDVPSHPALETDPDVSTDAPYSLSSEWDETRYEKPDATDSKATPAIPSLASLSKIEKIAISVLFAALALGATLTYIHFSNRVPTRPLVAGEIDLPVAGEIIEITAATTYWREPVTSGGNADIVRRGTQLIPVLKISLSSKSGVIRVFFRNEDGLVIGDGITRTVKGDAEITVAATAGFDDVGMHTAYRTGDNLPWTVQVFEAPDATAPREKFRKVLETEISTLIR